MMFSMMLRMTNTNTDVKKIPRCTTNWLSVCSRSISMFTYAYSWKKVNWIHVLRPNHVIMTETNVDIVLESLCGLRDVSPNGFHILPFEKTNAGKRISRPQSPLVLVPLHKPSPLTVLQVDAIQMETMWFHLSK